MVVITKAIKPKTLKIEAMLAELEKAAETFSIDLLSEFELTTAFWERKVKFERLVSVGPTSIDVLVGTDDEVYGYVNEGTEDHYIPTYGKPLAFQSIYVAKSSPGRIASNKGGASGPMAFSQGHWVSGIEPRDFDAQIAKEMEPKFKKEMQDAMKRARKVSDNPA